MSYAVKTLEEQQPRDTCVHDVKHVNMSGHTHYRAVSYHGRRSERTGRWEDTKVHGHVSDSVVVLRSGFGWVRLQLLREMHRTLPHGVMRTIDSYRYIRVVVARFNRTHGMSFSILSMI